MLDKSTIVEEKYILVYVITVDQVNHKIPDTCVEEMDAMYFYPYLTMMADGTLARCKFTS